MQVLRFFASLHICKAADWALQWRMMVSIYTCIKCGGVNMSAEQLPPKTSEIDQMITQPDDVQKVLTGEKTATRRNGRYADPGERWQIEGRTFEVHSVYRQSLGEMTDEHAKSEGFDSMEAYKNYILSMHKGMPWVPSMQVWVHEFREVL